MEMLVGCRRLDPRAIFDDVKFIDVDAGGKKYTIMIASYNGAPFVDIVESQPITLGFISYAATPRQEYRRMIAERVYRMLMQLDCSPCDIANDLVFLLDALGCTVDEDDNIHCIDEDEFVKEVVEKYLEYSEDCGE